MSSLVFWNVVHPHCKIVHIEEGRVAQKFLTESTGFRFVWIVLSLGIFPLFAVGIDPESLSSPEATQRRIGPRHL